MDTRSDSAPDPGSAPARGARLRAVAAGVGLTVVALVVSVLGGVALVVPVVLFGLDVETIAVFVALTAAGQLGFAVVAVAYAWLADLRIPYSLPDAGEIGYAVGGTVLALVLAGVLSALLAALGLLPGSMLEETAATNPEILLALAVLSVVLIAPAEELLFRGAIQTRLRRAFGPVGAIAGASLLFGSLHLANFTGAVAPIVAGALLIAFVGAVLGVLYEVTDNLVVPILAHGAYNFVLLGASYLTV